MAQKCDQCGDYGPIVMTTATGRRLDQKCADQFRGVAASLLAGGSQVGPVGGAVATAGWLSRIRKVMRRRRPAQ